MTIYISGKITGTTDYLNRFKEAEQHLKKAGHEVINPAELNLQFGTNRAWQRDASILKDKEDQTNG